MTVLYVPGPRLNVGNSVMPFAGSGEVLAVFETKLKNAIESLDFVIVPCMTWLARMHAEYVA